MKQCNKDTASGSSNRMSKSDRTTIRVELLVNIDSQILTYCNRLCCECFVCLDDIEVLNLHACLSHNLLGRSNRSDTHNLRSYTCKCASYESSHGLNAKLLSLLFAHNNDCCCTIIDTRCITSSNKSVRIDGTKLCKSFDGRTMTRSFIYLELDHFFFLLNHYRNDFVLECTVLLSFFSL